MRILMCSDVYFPRINGVSTSIETFRHSLGELGTAVSLVVPRYANEPEAANIVRVPGWKVPGDPEDRLVSWRSMFRAVQTAAESADVIHVQTPFVAHYAGVAAARKLGKPVIATYHTLFEEYLTHYAPFLPENWLRGQARKFSRRQCNALDAVIVPSSAMRDRLTDYGVTCPIHILPTGIPVDALGEGDGRAFRYRHGILSTRPMALFVGRVAHEKNIGFLLQSLIHARAQCPEILLVIAGEGPAMEDLQRQVKQLGLRDSVQFIGYLDRQRELPACYAAADVFVFASRTETQGLVLLEAMAAGLPVVALAEMGTVDILAPGCGGVVSSDDPRQFGAVTARLLNNAGQRARLAQEARLYAHEWSDAAMARRLAALYEDLLAEKRSTAMNMIVRTAQL